MTRPQKRRRSDFFLYEVEDPTAAEQKLIAAKTVLNLVRARHIANPEHDEVKQAEARVSELKAEYEECFGRIDLLAPLRADLDALVQEDSERRSAVEAERKAKEQEDDDEDEFTPDSFFIRLLELCAVPLPGEERTTAKEWSEFLSAGEWQAEERLQLMNKVYLLTRHKQYDVGKG